MNVDAERSHATPGKPPVGAAAAPPSIWQAAAMSYLVLPLAIFALFFSSYLLMVPSVVFIGWASWQFVRGGVAQSVSRGVAGALLALACTFIACSGMLPPLWQNGDYAKHYAIMHLLMEHHWPVVVDLGAGPEILRYSLGWYLVPAALSKLLGPRTIEYTVALWSTLGLWLVFLVLAEALKPKRARWAVAAAVLFMSFSGMDQFGAALTQHFPGYPDHFEWWATFYQFSSMMTNLVWVPQHGLSAWLVILLLLGAGASSRVVEHAGLLVLAFFFWSPLCAFGTVPFVLVAARANRFRGLLSLSNFLSLVALAPLVLGYLLTNTAQIPHTFVFNIPGWTVQNLLSFWLLEFGIFALTVWAIGTERKLLLTVAVAVLMLVPLFWLGGLNDFAMRVPTAALVALAFVGIEIILNKPWQTSLPLMLVFVLCAGTPYAELSRGFRRAGPSGRMNAPNLIMSMDPTNTFRSQYFAPYPNRFVRSVKNVDVFGHAPTPQPAPAAERPSPEAAPAEHKKHRQKKPRAPRDAHGSP